MSDTINPAGRTQPVTYSVMESRPLVSDGDADMVVITGRTNEGITLLMSTKAADVLAQLLARYEAAHQRMLASGGEDGVVSLEAVEVAAVDNYDPDVWTHTVVDLLANRGMALSAAALGQEIVYAATSPSGSGYLPPTPKRGHLAVVDAGPVMTQRAAEAIANLTLADRDARS